MLEPIEADKIIKRIGAFAAENTASSYEIAFRDGDVYLCHYSTDDCEDNDEEPDSPTYEEWYAIDFRVIDVLRAGPNKDSQFDFITISRKHFPSQVACDGKVLFIDSKGH